MTDVFGGMVAALTAGKVDQTFAPREERYAGKASNAEGIAGTWCDPHVRKDRLTRQSVKVTLPDGTARTYRSVRDAFRELRLPDAKHVRFRGFLKASTGGTANYLVECSGCRATNRLLPVDERTYCDGCRRYNFKLVPLIKPSRVV